MRLPPRFNKINVHSRSKRFRFKCFSGGCWDLLKKIQSACPLPVIIIIIVMIQLLQTHLNHELFIYLLLLLLPVAYNIFHRCKTTQWSNGHNLYRFLSAERWTCLDCFPPTEQEKTINNLATSSIVGLTDAVIVMLLILVHLICLLFTRRLKIGAQNMQKLQCVWYCRKIGKVLIFKIVQ